MAEKTTDKPRAVKSHDVALDKEYIQWIQDIKQRFRNSQIKAAVKVNSEQLLFILINDFRCRSTGLANAIPVRLLYQKRQLIAFASITGSLEGISWYARPRKNGAVELLSR